MLTLLFSPTYAITGNSTSDSTPYIGVVVLFSDAARQQPIGYSTGIFISPTVVLTAGHSTLGVAAVSVCFDQGPISYSIQNGQIVYSGDSPVYNGIPIPYPAYAASVIAGSTNGNKQFSTSDVGVIILDRPVTDVTEFATLPPVGIVDTLPIKTNLQVVGYGVQEQITPKNNGPYNSWVGSISRNTAIVQLLSTSFQGSDDYIRCTANPVKTKEALLSVTQAVQYYTTQTAAVKV
jgi:hypothetical protein